LERKIEAKSFRVVEIMRKDKTLAVLFFIACCLLFGTRSFAQSIAIKLRDSTTALLHIDSANWNEAWIEVDGASPGTRTLTPKDIEVRTRDRSARVLSVDSIGAKYKSVLALSFVLDNSGSMFHAYDSLVGYCDSIAEKVARGATFQAVTFDTRYRGGYHLYTNRSSVFLAQHPFTDSVFALERFWHFFDTVRTEFTPLYDALAAALANIEERRLHGDTARNDVLLVVTDGADNASRASIELLAQLFQNSNVRLFAINFRTEEDN